MNEWILFTIGILIGGMIGIMGMTMISVRKQVDMIGEIMDLRVQRKLLRDELVKKQTKPTPRKYRKNKLNV
tara:strand:+ start:543 stop:755 length:213 start_codon:yes stop_codon:yes gene_type:complete